jgi:hypothetical protein
MLNDIYYAGDSLSFQINIDVQSDYYASFESKNLFLIIEKDSKRKIIRLSETNDKSLILYPIEFKIKYKSNDTFNIKVVGDVFSILQQTSTHGYSFYLFDPLGKTESVWCKVNTATQD